MICYNLDNDSIIKFGAVMKSKILKILRDNRDGYISGENLSGKLGVSRAAIWKHINVLRQEGYNIESITNKGYRLISETDDLNAISLNAMIENIPFLDFAHYFETIDSTNLEAKRYALTNLEHEGIIVASEQTSGKGRLGRHWDSEKKSGLWMSMLLRPKIKPESASSLTLVAATAMCEALENLTGLPIGIKWPNDLVCQDRKICGILTEMSAEFNSLHYIVLGIGVNLKQQIFSEELANKATSLSLLGVTLQSKILLNEFLKIFSKYYALFVKNDMTNVINHHRSHSVTLNREVSIISQNEVRSGYALDISENGSLIIENDKGEKEVVFFGEVSVRGINGYL